MRRSSAPGSPPSRRAGGARPMPSAATTAVVFSDRRGASQARVLARFEHTTGGTARAVRADDERLIRRRPRTSTEPARSGALAVAGVAHCVPHSGRADRVRWRWGGSAARRFRPRHHRTGGHRDHAADGARITSPWQGDHAVTAPDLGDVLALASPGCRAGAGNRI
jgi:hypothetical protein